MEIREILDVVGRRLWLIILGTLVVAAATLIITLGMEPVYRASVTMIVRQNQSVPFQDRNSLLLGQDLARTYSELMKTRPLIEMVVNNLDLDMPASELVNGKISTELVADTQLLILHVEDSSPVQASNIANEIAYTFISMQNTEQQTDSLTVLEEAILAQMRSLKATIDSRLAAGDVGSGTGTAVGSDQVPLSDQQAAYASLATAYMNLRATRSQLLGIDIVEPAIPPTQPIRPDPILYTLLGAFGGVILSTGAAFVLASLDRTLRTADEAAQALAQPILGALPTHAASIASNDLTTVAMPNAPTSEAYRTLRTNIRFAGVDTPLQTLLVTSADPGVGKSTTAANLGVVFAQSGLDVVLLDIDLRYPALARFFDLEGKPGLTDLMIGNCQHIEDCAFGTEIEGLRVIPSGPVPPNPSELLGSRRLEQLLTEAKASSDLVILDAPPVLAVTDALVLAPKTDGVLLMIEAGRTSQDLARQAIRALEHVDAKLLGVVLTKVKVKRSSYYYYKDRRKTGVIPFARRLLARFSRSH